MLFEKEEMKDNLINDSESPSEDQCQFFVEADAKPEPYQPSSEEEESPDLVDKCFNEMGGFGKLQKISYVMNTLA